MNAILKHTLRSISGSKAQVAVIMVTVTLVCAMLFSAFSLSDLFYAMNIAEYSNIAQGADMLVGDISAGGEVFSRARVERILEESPEDIAFVQYFLRMTTIMKTETSSRPVVVDATDLNEYLKSANLNFVSKYTDNSLWNPNDIAIEHKPAIVGESFAKNIGVQCGDNIEVYIASYGIYTKLTIVYIALDEGIFGAPSSMNILTDLTALSHQGLVNAVYISFTNPNLFNKYELKFNEYLSGILVNEGSLESYVREIVTNNTMLLVVGIIFITAVMLLILLSAYLVIARNRTAEMTIFKCAGATPRQVVFVLLFEVFIYALPGVIAGLALGRLIMEFAVRALLPVASSIIKYQFWKYLTAGILSVWVSVIACLAPAISLAKKTIRELTSADTRTVKGENLPLFIVSSVVLAGGATALRFMSGFFVIVTAVVLVAVIAVWIAHALPYIIKFFSFLMSKLKLKGSVRLATTTARRNRGIRTIAGLVAVIIGFGFLVTNVIDVVKIALTPFNTRFSADFVALSFDNLDLVEHSLVQKEIEAVSGIKRAGFYNFSEFKINGGEQIYLMHGVSDFWTLEQSAKGGLSANTLKNWELYDNPIVLNQDIMRELRLKVGDKIVLSPEVQDFSHLSFSFTVAGIDYTTTEYDKIGFVDFSKLSGIAGSVVYIAVADGSRNLNATFLDLRNTLESMVLFKGEENAFPLRFTYALPFNEWAYAGRETVGGLNTLLTLLQIAVFAVSLLAVINVSVVTAMDRRREFLIYRLSGMSEADYINFALSEGIISALSAGITGLILSFSINQFLPAMSGLINKFINFGVFPLTGLLISGVASLVFLSAWISVAFAKRKIKLTEINARL